MLPGMEKIGPQNEARQTPLLISIQKPVLTFSNIDIIQYTLIL